MPPSVTPRHTQTPHISSTNRRENTDPENQHRTHGTIANVARTGLAQAATAPRTPYWSMEKEEFWTGGLKTALVNFIAFNVMLRGTAIATSAAELEPGLRAVIQSIPWTLNNVPGFAVNAATGRDHLPVKIRGADRDIFRHVLTEVMGPLIPAAAGMTHDMLVALINKNIPDNFYGDPESWSSFAVREVTRAVLVNGLSAFGAGVFRENCRGINSLSSEPHEITRNNPYTPASTDSTLEYVAGYLKTVAKGLVTTNMLQSTGYAAIGALVYAGLQYKAFTDFNPANFDDPTEKLDASISQAACVFGAIFAGWAVQHSARIVAGQRLFDNPTTPIRETNAG